MSEKTQELILKVVLALICGLAVGKASGDQWWGVASFWALLLVAR